MTDQAQVMASTPEAERQAGSPALVHRRLGGQLLQASLADGRPLFYLSPLSTVRAAVAPARGGVPVLFPQFADEGTLPKHGFARNLPWQLLGEEGASAATYGLDVGPDKCPDWPHAACLELEARAFDTVLSLKLRVKNIGTSTFSWTGGLHPYFVVDDLECCRLTGLAGLSVRDRYDVSARRQVDDAAHWGRPPCERLYDACPPLVLSTGDRALALEATGFDQWMVWNPGEVGGNALADLPAGDWRRFLCVEPVRVARPVTLAPGEMFEGTLQVRVHEG